MTEGLPMPAVLAQAEHESKFRGWGAVNNLTKTS